MPRRPLLAAAACLALLLPDLARARSWLGIDPGTSTQADVVARFGEPSTRGRLEGRTALVYKGEQAISGTRQAQFVLGDDGRVVEVNVFPAAPLDREALLGTYGTEPQKTYTDDFRLVWRYRASGVTIFFAKDGSVEAIRFQAGERPPRPSPASEPRPGATPAPPAGQ